MNAYVAVARSSFRRQTTYRVATAAGLFTNTVFGFVLASVLRAVYAERELVGDLDVVRALTFTFVAQGLLTVMGAFGWREVAERVGTGDIAVDLYRPVSFSSWWAAVWLGRAAFSIVARGVPPFLIGALVFPLRLPERPGTWAWFLAAVAVGTLVASRFWLMVNLAAFWLLDVRGLVSLAVMVLTVASGFVVPLTFIDGWPGALCRWSPFAVLAQFPVEVFLELRPGWRAVLPALLWLGALEAVVRIMLRRATRRLVVQGG